MVVIANQERQSERSDCYEKNDDSLEEDLQQVNKRPNPEILVLGHSGAGKSSFFSTTNEAKTADTGSSMIPLWRERRIIQIPPWRERRIIQIPPWRERRIIQINELCLHVEKSIKESEELLLRLEEQMKVRREKHSLRLLLEKIYEEPSDSTVRARAIDFGPTYAGNAFSFKHEYEADTSTGFVNNGSSQAGSLASVIRPKVDLVEHDGKTFGAFGHEAEDKYTDDNDYGQYFYTARYKMMLKKVGKSGPRNNTIGGKYSKVWYERSTDRFDFLAERKTGFQELPKTELKKSPIPLWQGYCQDQSLGKSKTLLSKPLHDERSETENFSNYSSKPAEHSTSAKEQDAKIPDNDRLLCKVCYMFELNIVFLPCSHMVACRKCAAKLKTCPVCRSGIKEALPAILHE